MTTRIEWCDETWNPMTGCTPISDGCEHCYAKRIAERHLAATRCPECGGTGRIHILGVYDHPTDDPCHLCHGTGNVGFAPTFHPDRLDIPLHWRKPRRIFVCSMSDLFHEAFTDEQIDRVWEVMTTENHAGPSSWNGERWTMHPLHTFMVLTKRPERMRKYILRRQAKAQAYADKFKDCPTEAMRTSPAAISARQIATEPRPGIWLGVTAEDQQRADERIPILLDTPAAVRFVSLEPMLGPVIVDDYTDYTQDEEEAIWRVAEREPVTQADRKRMFPKLDWVIVGGETGPGARPMQPEWALNVYQQCKAAGVPFFWKQAGTHWGREVSNAWAHPCQEMLTTREFPEVQP